MPIKFILRPQYMAAALLPLLIVGCNEGSDASAPNSNQEAHPAPTHEPIALDGFGVVVPNKKTYIDLSSYLKGTDIKIDSYIEEQSGNLACGQATQEGLGMNVHVSNDGALCQYKYSAYTSDNSLNSSAEVMVLATNSSAPVLPPKSETAKTGGPQKTITLPFTDANKSVDTVKLQSSLPTGLHGKVQKASSSSINYTPSQIPGWERIIYTVKDKSSTSSQLGYIYVTISDKENSNPVIAEPVHTYQGDQKGKIKNNNGKITIDLGREKTTNNASLITDDDGWQLVSATMIYTGPQFSVNPISIANKDDVTNKQFQIDTDVMTELAGREFAVQYIVTDNYGGFSQGIINFKLEINSGPTGDKFGKSKNILPPPRYEDIKDVTPGVKPTWHTASWNGQVYDGTYGLVTSSLGMQLYCNQYGRIANTQDIQNLFDSVGEYPSTWPTDIGVVQPDGTFKQPNKVGNKWQLKDGYKDIDWDKGVFAVCAESSFSVRYPDKKLFHLSDATSIPSSSVDVFKVASYTKNADGNDTVTVSIAAHQFPDITIDNSNVITAYDNVSNEYSVYVKKVEADEAYPGVLITITNTKGNCTTSCTEEKKGGPFYISGNNPSSPIMNAKLTNDKQTFTEATNNNNNTLQMDDITSRSEKLNFEVQLKDKSGYPIYFGNNVSREINININDNRWDKGFVTESGTQTQTQYKSSYNFTVNESEKFCPSTNSLCKSPTNKITGAIVASGSGFKDRPVKYAVTGKINNQSIPLSETIAISQIDSTACDYSQMSDKDKMLCVKLFEHNGAQLTAAPTKAFIDYIEAGDSSKPMNTAHRDWQLKTIGNKAYNTLTLLPGTVHRKSTKWCELLTTRGYGSKTWEKLTEKTILNNQNWPVLDNSTDAITFPTDYRGHLFSRNGDGQWTGDKTPFSVNEADGPFYNKGGDKLQNLVGAVYDEMRNGSIVKTVISSITDPNIGVNLICESTTKN